MRADPVLIVGAGPAGATAAFSLARAGVPVRLIDRAPFPRNKPCGGGISVRIRRRFPYLQDALRRIPVLELSRLYLEGPGGESAVIESDVPAALMIRRLEFDALLVSLAVEAGAELVTGVDVVQAAESPSHGDGLGRITLTARDGRRFESSTLIAADGVYSVIARRLGLNRGWPSTSVALDMMEETPRSLLRDVDPSTLWVAYGFALKDSQARRQAADGQATSRQAEREAPEGYAYIFPKQDHVNVGIGYVLSYFKDSVDQAPYELQRAFVGRLRSRGVVAGDSVRANFTPFQIPVGGPLRRPGRGRILLVGDAGGFVNGFTAEGIYYAMVSGELAAKTIARSWPSTAADLSEPYRRAVDQEMGPELRDSVLVQRYLFGDRRRIAAAIAAAPHQGSMTKLVLDLAIGRRSYAAVRRRMFARLPMLAARLVTMRVGNWVADYSMTR